MHKMLHILLITVETEMQNEAMSKKKYYLNIIKTCLLCHFYKYSSQPQPRIFQDLAGN